MIRISTVTTFLSEDYFIWDTGETSCVRKIDFMLDNLTNVPISHTISKIVWCENQNRIEIHIKTKETEIMRSTYPKEIQEGIDLSNNNEVELVLRICRENETLPVCEEFELPRPSADPLQNKGTKGILQQDKDGAIIIGTAIIGL